MYLSQRLAFTLFKIVFTKQDMVILADFEILQGVMQRWE